MAYGLNDICITPARVSRVMSRSECDPYNEDCMLPLFTAPMNSVINEGNYKKFLENKINTIIPRGVNIKRRWDLASKTFIAVGLEEFSQFCIDHEPLLETTNTIWYVCIDVANGHMKHLIDMCAEAKEIFGNRLVLMTGNIANPETYVDYAKAGIDFVRAGIGGGACCVTACNTAIYTASAQLIIETVQVKNDILRSIEDFQNLNLPNPYKSIPLIIADGGYNSYDRIIKALALGADYVMIGKLFAQAEEACGEVIKTVNNGDKEIRRSRLYYGMSTKRAQKETGKKKLHTSEGIEITVPILYTLSGWCENFVDYLRSAMSYTDSFNLEEFKKAEWRVISPSEYLAYYK